MKWRSNARWFVFLTATAVVLLLAMPVTVSGRGTDPVVGAISATTQRDADVSSSSSEDEYDRFLRSVTALYHAVNNDDAAGMAQSLSVITYRFKLLPMSDTASLAGMQALADQLTKTSRSLALAKPDKQVLRSEAATLWLAADAMARPDQPLWHNYQPVLAGDLEALQGAINSNNENVGYASESASAILDQLNAHYEMIRTAVSMGDSSRNVVRADAVLHYARTVILSDPSNQLLTVNVIQPLREAMFDLFPSANDQEESAIVPAAVGASWAWPAMMGSFIVTVLTWVGYRRYRNDGYAGASGNRGAANRKDAAESLLERWNNRDKK
ncbi:sporulation protein YpjB [Cohnella yongneupensis]|uniref:Sporulation protein YpjB n=1 Tax=Cohnella yongneupensis TaxID=425006 RepID=A0ABW0R4U8_9BACL